MKFKSILTLIAALGLCGSAVAADDKEDTPLSKEMSAMNKSLRTLKRQATEATKKADNLALVGKMLANVDAATKLDPAKTKDQPAGDKAAYLEKYKKQMGDLKAGLDELKAAIEKGDNDAVAKAFEKLSDIKEKGHKDFQPDE